MTAALDIEDVIGGGAPTVARQLEDHVLRGQKSKYGGLDTPMDVSGLHAGVTVGWLAQAFRMDPKTVKARLANCPVLKAHQRGYIYEFKVAVEYLVTPKVDIEEYLKKAKTKDLPTRLQSEYWQAMRARQMWEREAGALWPTEDVLATFSEVAGMLRSELQLWVDNLERAVAVTAAQRDFLNDEVHSLQSRLYEKLVSLPQSRYTPPSSAREQTPEKPAAIEDFSDVL